MLRYRADWRAIAYLATAAAVAAIHWNLGALALPVPTIEVLGEPVQPLLYLLSLFLGVATAVISHNHNHLSMWKSKPVNLVTSWVISIFYGHPAIGWVPTHNMVHHKFNNRPGDSSRAPKVFKRNHLFALLIYPTLTSMAQTKEIKAYIAGLKTKNRKQYWSAISEYVVFFGFMAVIFLIDWKKALLFFLIPQQFALFTIQVFNYVQHIEADENSEWNHSRNFVSPVLNVLLFNNGYHTVHHQTPGLHWTKTPEAHAKVAHKIHPALQQKSWWGYMIWTFLIRPLVPGAGAPNLAAPRDERAAA
jgi:beta-carotene hydroxylase